MKFRKSSKVIEANQFRRHGEYPFGVRTEEDGRAYVVTMQEQKVYIQPGEWVAQEDDGVHFYPIADSYFKENFIPVENYAIEPIICNCGHEHDCHECGSGRCFECKCREFAKRP